MQQFLRIAEINILRARVAITILRQITRALSAPTETNQELLEEMVALGRTLRRTILAWQRRYAANPLVAHVFAARKQLRRAEQFRRTKSAKPIERLVYSTYLSAEQLGFTGSVKEWERLLEITGPTRY